MASIGRRDEEAGRSRNQPNTKKRAVSSKYDVHKVKVWLGDQRDHYYILSRFLVSRSLTITKIPSTKAVKIALELKKHLVDHDQLNVSQAELEETLFSLMRAKGFGQPYIDCYRTVSAFYTLRQPLIIIVCGAPCTGKSTIAQQLAARLNMPNVMQTDVICELMRRNPSGALPPQPPWVRTFKPPPAGAPDSPAGASSNQHTACDGERQGAGTRSNPIASSVAGHQSQGAGADVIEEPQESGSGAGAPASLASPPRAPPSAAPAAGHRHGSAGAGSSSEDEQDWGRRSGGERGPGQDELMLREFRIECGIVRKALDGDFNKALNDGKPLIVEGVHLDPGQLIGELQELGIVLLPLEPAPTTPGSSSQPGEPPSPPPQLQVQPFGQAGTAQPESPAAVAAAVTAGSADCRDGLGGDGATCSAQELHAQPSGSPDATAPQALPPQPVGDRSSQPMPDPAMATQPSQARISSPPLREAAAALQPQARESSPSPPPQETPRMRQLQKHVSWGHLGPAALGAEELQAGSDAATGSGAAAAAHSGTTDGACTETAGEQLASEGPVAGSHDDALCPSGSVLRSHAVDVSLAVSPEAERGVEAETALLRADSPAPCRSAMSSHGGSSPQTSVAGGGGGGSEGGPLSDVDNYGDADTDGEGGDSGGGVSPLRTSATATAAAQLDSPLAPLRRVVSHPVMPHPEGDGGGGEYGDAGADDDTLDAAYDGDGGADAAVAPSAAAAGDSRRASARLVPGLPPPGPAKAASTAAVGLPEVPGGFGSIAAAARLLERTRTQNARMFGAGAGAAPAGSRATPPLLSSASASFGRIGSWSTLDLHHVKSSLAGLLRMGSAAHGSRLSPSPRLYRAGPQRGSCAGGLGGSPGATATSPGAEEQGGRASCGSVSAGGAPPLLRAFSAAAGLSQRPDVHEPPPQHGTRDGEVELLDAAVGAGAALRSDAGAAGAAEGLEAATAVQPASPEDVAASSPAPGDSPGAVPSTPAPAAAAANAASGGGAPSLPPLFVPVVLRMSEADHRLALEDNMALHAGGGVWAEGAGGGGALGGALGAGEGGCCELDPEELLRRSQAIQRYLCSFESQGLPVINVKYGNFQEALDILHEYVLMCIQAAMEQLSGGNPDALTASSS